MGKASREEFIDRFKSLEHLDGENAPIAPPGKNTVMAWPSFGGMTPRGSRRNLRLPEDRFKPIKKTVVAFPDAPAGQLRHEGRSRPRAGRAGSTALRGRSGPGARSRARRSCASRPPASTSSTSITAPGLYKARDAADARAGGRGHGARGRARTSGTLRRATAWPGPAASAGYAEKAASPADELVKLPDGVSTRQGAAAMLQGMTAHYLAISTYPLKAGDTCLVHAGAGGVGLLLTQIAKMRGARVLTTVSTAEKAKLSREAGADDVIDYTTQDFEAEAKRETGGRGVQVVYDSVGKTTFEKSLASLAPRGMLVLFGQSSGPVGPFDLQILAQTRLALPDAADASSVATSPTARSSSRGPATSSAWVRDGRLKLRIGHELPARRGGGGAPGARGPAHDREGAPCLTGVRPESSEFETMAPTLTVRDVRRFGLTP